MGLGKSFKKAVGKVSKSVGLNTYGSVLKAEANGKEAAAKQAVDAENAKRSQEAKALEVEMDAKRKKSKVGSNSLISMDTVEGFLRSILG